MSSSFYVSLLKGVGGWSGGAKLCISRYRGVQLILAYSWARPAILAAGKGREGMFLFVRFLHFYSCSSIFPVPLFHLFYYLLYVFSPRFVRRSVIPDDLLLSYSKQQPRICKFADTCIYCRIAELYILTSSSIYVENTHTHTRTNTYIILTPLKRRFYIVKLGFTGVQGKHFTLLKKNNRLWVVVRTALPRRF